MSFLIVAFSLTECKVKHCLSGNRKRDYSDCPSEFDVDFDAQEIHVTPKQDTAETWQWLIKDTDRRTLPLRDEALAELVEYQSQQPQKYAYVFVPPERFDRIQQLRKQDRWTLSDSRLKVINNFRREFERILRRRRCVPEFGTRQLLQVNRD